MNELVDLVEELEGLDFMDLGDAAVETKQVAPSSVVPDSTYVWGWASR